MKIKHIIGREIFDSRGEPTIEVELTLEDGQYVTASVPSGASRGEFEAVEMRDDEERLMGLGVHQALTCLEREIAPMLINKEPDVVMMDSMLVELDGTDNKARLGANTILAVSCAVCKAQALVNNVETYQLLAQLSDLEQVALPHPMFNMINGGLHANNKLHVQEFLVTPIGLPTFRETMEAGVTFYQVLGQILLEHNHATAVGDEGGYAPQCASEEEVFDYLMETSEQMQELSAASFVIGLDVAASQFYSKEKQHYRWYGNAITTDDLFAKYAHWLEQYPIFSLEDGFSEYDTRGWQALMKAYGQNIQIVGDDLFATSSERILKGIENGLANAAIIKPNQAGTVTETLQAVALCREHNLTVIASHRSGETNDTFIADLALGARAAALKAGGCSRGERIAKYNHLLRIEDEFTLSALGA